MTIAQRLPVATCGMFKALVACDIRVVASLDLFLYEGDGKGECSTLSW